MTSFFRQLHQIRRRSQDTLFVFLDPIDQLLPGQSQIQPKASASHGQMMARTWNIQIQVSILMLGLARTLHEVNMHHTVRQWPLHIKVYFQMIIPPRIKIRVMSTHCLNQPTQSPQPPYYGIIRAHAIGLFRAHLLSVGSPYAFIRPWPRSSKHRGSDLTRSCARLNQFVTESGARTSR